MITEPLSWGNSYKYFLAHLIGMPSWHKVVILVSALVCGSGVFGSVAGRLGATTQPAAVATTAPSNASDTFFSSISPHMIKIGASIVVGFVIGWYLRAFIKLTILFCLLVGGAAWLAAHYGWFSVNQSDVESVRQRGMEATHWVTEHAEGWKDWLLAKLPSASGGTFGAWIGFQRK